MPLIDLNFYIFSLYVLIGCVIFAVMIVLYSFRVDEVNGISNRLFRIYFITGVLGWGGNIIRDAGFFLIELEYSASAYIVVTCLLMLSLFESARRLFVFIPFVFINLILVLYCLTNSGYFSLFITFSVYGLCFYLIIFVGMIHTALKSRNVGYSIISVASLVVVLSSLSQIYFIVMYENYEVAYGLALTHSAISFALVGLGFMAVLLFDKQSQLSALALNDPLTGLLNRRGMDIKISISINSAERFDKSVSAIALDIDFFKKINDKYGHDAGDAVLVSVGKLLSSHARSSDVSSRLGGEEFIIILPDTENNTAMIIAERIRKEVELILISHDGNTIKLTSSFGVATHRGKINVDALLKDADKALYSAKSSGRNRVCNFEDTFVD